MQIVVTSETDVDAYQWVTKLSANVKEEDVIKLGNTAKELLDFRDYLNAEAVFNLLYQLNKNKEWMKEEGSIMGQMKSIFSGEYREKLLQQAEQIEQKDAQIEQKDAQIEQKDATIINLQARIAELEAQLNAKQG